MNTLVHADLFFFVTTVFVGILSLSTAIAMYYVIGILRDVKQLSAILKEEGERIGGDLAHLHLVAREEGSKLRAMLGLLLAFGRHKRTTKEKSSDH